MEKYFLQEGKHAAPKEEQKWRISQQRAFELASDAVEQEALAKEAQEAAEMQLLNAAGAKRIAEEAGEEERRLKEAFKEAVERQRLNSLRR